jgi:cytochrome c553
MRTTASIALTFMMVVGCLAPAAAGDLQAGRQLSQASCAACHGVNGIGIIALYPNLAGQKNDYLVAQLRAFRDGNRTNPIMSPMATHLSDVDIENLAAYYSALR